MVLVEGAMEALAAGAGEAGVEAVAETAAETLASEAAAEAIEVVSDEVFAETVAEQLGAFAEDLIPEGEVIPGMDALNAEAGETIAGFLGSGLPPSTELPNGDPSSEDLPHNDGAEDSAESEDVDEVLTPDGIFTAEEWQNELDEQGVRQRWGERLDETTQEFVFEKFTPEQEAASESVFSEDGSMSFEQYVKERMAGSGESSELKFNSEAAKDQAAEDVKLLLRMAIKLGAKVVAILAKNMAKEIDDPAVSFMLNSVADFANEGGQFFDEVLSEDRKSVV